MNVIQVIHHQGDYYWTIRVHIYMEIITHHRAKIQLHCGLAQIAQVSMNQTEFCCIQRATKMPSFSLFAFTFLFNKIVGKFWFVIHSLLLLRLIIKSIFIISKINLQLTRIGKLNCKLELTLLFLSQALALVTYHFLLFDLNVQLVNVERC